jgi:hypothetical protein
MRDVNERQRNFVFPDTARNLGGFLRGIYEQKLNLAQWVGSLILVMFYVIVFVGLVAENWPTGRESFWQKILHGYGPYLLLSLPLLLFFLLLPWRMHRTR